MPTYSGERKLMSKCLVRAMSRADVARVSTIHQEAFPTFFLTSLGTGFLGAFYSACSSFDESVALVAEVDGTVTGFVVGVPDHRVFHRYLRRNWAVVFARHIAPAIVRNPRIAARFVIAAVSRGPQLPKAEGALLMSIAVSPRTPSKGVGRQLLMAFGEHLQSKGCHFYRLTTDRDRNDRVNAFYRSAGLTLEHSYVTREGRAMNQYVCRLDSAGTRSVPLSFRGGGRQLSESIVGGQGEVSQENGKFRGAVLPPVNWRGGARQCRRSHELRMVDHRPGREGL
jgi:GNAT superfamily N-acetyltransferase